MGFFDRFTGKELAQSIDAYTNQYGEILVGMHRAILRHQQQLENLQRQMNALTDGNGRYIQLLDILVQHKETIEQSMDHHSQNMTQRQANLRAQQQLQEIDSRISVMQGDLQSMEEQLADQIKDHKETVAEWSKKHAGLDQSISSLKKHVTEVDQNISSLRKQLAELDQGISSVSVQFEGLQREFKENAKRWNAELQSALEDVKQQHNAQLAELQQSFDSRLKEMDEHMETKMIDFHKKLLKADYKMENIRQQLEETNEHLQKQWEASEVKRKQAVLIFSSMFVLFAIWEVYQYFQL